MENVKFDSAVKNIENIDNQWEVTYNNYSEKFDAVVIANGHYETKITPDFPGTFNGEILHSHSYKSP